MASVDWQRFKSTGHVMAVMRHDCKDTREACEEHTNADIQRDMTEKNTGRWDTYAEAKKRYEERMAELPSPRRKDSVLGLGFSIPAPENLPENQEEAWFSRVFDLMGNEFGLNNIVCYAIHRDEVHEYKVYKRDEAGNRIKDENGKNVLETRVSRVHVQGVLVPEFEGRVCARSVTTRARMIKINNAIEDMSKEEFGLKWLTGESQKSDASVEKLKLDSLKAEVEMLQAENERLKDLVSGPKLKKARQQAKEEYEANQKAAEEAAARAAEAEAKRIASEQEAAEASQRLQERLKELRECEDTQKQLKAATEALRASQRKVMESLKSVEDGDKRAKVSNNEIAHELEKRNPKLYHEIGQSLVAEKTATAMKQAKNIRGRYKGDLDMAFERIHGMDDSFDLSL